MSAVNRKISTTGRQLGNRGWSWDDVLPFFRKAENWEGKEDAVHGKGGPLFTSHGRDKPLLCQAAVEAAKQLGCEYREDVNDLPSGAGDSIGWVQQTRGGRRRASSARSYLRPATQAAQSAGYHWRTGPPRAVRRNARDRCRILAQRQYRTRRYRGRGDSGGGRDRFATYPATFRCRRSRASALASAFRRITNCAASGATSRTIILRGYRARWRARRA